MSIKLNGAINGSVELDVPDAIGSDLNITIPGAAGTLDRLERAGNILQVVQNHIVTTQSDVLTENTQATISGFSQSITPTYSSSKILIRIRWNGELSVTNNQNIVFRILRDNVAIGLPASASQRNLGISGLSQGYWDSDANSTQDNAWVEYLDSPGTTSSITYKLAVISSTAGTLFTNRTGSDTDTPAGERLTGGITLMEVAG